MRLEIRSANTFFGWFTILVKSLTLCSTTMEKTKTASKIGIYGDKTENWGNIRPKITHNTVNKP